MLRELDPETQAQVDRWMKAGDDVIGADGLNLALSHYRQALRLIPEPKTEWRIAADIYAALGNCSVEAGSWDFGYWQTYFRFPGTEDNAHAHKQLGKAYYHTPKPGYAERALTEFRTAIRLAGREKFAGQKPEYLAFVDSRERLETRDLLLLLDSRFHDWRLKDYFYCKDCIVIEGLLAAFPALKDSLDVRRIPYPRPRSEVIALLGDKNQNLPVLILADDAPSGIADGHYGDRRFVGDIGKLLEALHVRHGIPRPHP